MVQETGVQSQVASYQRPEKWYLIPPWLTLSNIRYVSRVKWINPGKEVVPFLHLGVVAIEKGAFWSPLTTVANYVIMVLLYYYAFILIEKIVPSLENKQHNYASNWKKLNKLDITCVFFWRL